jgi:hypothetical protein
MAVPSRMGIEPAGREPDDDGALIVRSVRDPEQFATVFRRHAAEIQRYTALPPIRTGGYPSAIAIVAGPG